MSVWLQTVLVGGHGISNPDCLTYVWTDGHSNGHNMQMERVGYFWMFLLRAFDDGKGISL